MSAALLFLMDDLERIELNGDTRGVESGEERGEINGGKRTEQHGCGPVKTDGPAKRLLVDDENENEGKKIAEDEAGEIREQAEQAGFNQDELANLLGGSAEKAQEAELNAAVKTLVG